MVYSTCTIFDEENFDVVRQFLESHPNFEQVEISSDKADMIKEGCIFYYSRNVSYRWLFHREI